MMTSILQAPLADSDLKDRKLESLLELVSELYGNSFARVLVVGCGSGREANALSTRFACEVEGIDVDGSNFEDFDNPKLHLRTMDAANLTYPDDNFDLLYSFHAIEHIADIDRALQEMRRVLKPGGVFCIGTPNKKRLVGYIGVAISLRTKILWNLEDWKMRLTGRWDNALGAHAGFTREGLQSICNQTFGETSDLTSEYYRRLYSSKRKAIELIISLGFTDRAFPAVYAIGRRIT